MNLTDQWLQEAVGWQAMKEAKAIFKAGAVLEAERDGKLLKGVIQRAGSPQPAGFRMESPTNLENLCRCPSARKYGMMCAHSAAVVLGIIHGLPEAAGEKKAASQGSPKPGNAPSVPPQPVRTTLNPRFAELWEKGRVPVSFARRDGEAEVADGPVTNWLVSVGVTDLPAQTVLNPKQANALLTALQGNPEALIGDAALTVSDLPASRLRVKVTRDGDDFVVTPLPWIGADQQMLGDWIWFPGRNLLQPLRSGPDLAEASWQNILESCQLKKPTPVRINKAEFFRDLGPWQDCLEFMDQPQAAGWQVLQSRPSFLARFEGSMNALSGQVDVLYPADVEFSLGQDPTPGTFPIDEPRTGAFLLRNSALEKAATERMENAGFRMGKDGQFQLRGDSAIGQFLASTLPDLKRDADWEIELGERFRFVTRDIEVIRPQFQSMGVGNNWLSFAVSYSGDADSVQLSHSDVQKLLTKSQLKTTLPNGKTAILDVGACEELGEVLYDVQPTQEGEGVFRARPAQEAFLREALGEDFQPATPSLQPLGTLEDILRDYQREGVLWMGGRILPSGGACLLADEMGLGKTLQSLAAVELLLHEQGGKSLIVCPTSLLRNWEQETQRFLPDRKVHVHHGPNRWKAKKSLEKAEFIITSYALMVRDREKLAEMEFQIAVLDEASAIKNPDTQTSKAARQLPASRRIALTGTPVENSVKELWSIFEFLVPGYLGGRAEFRERYENPIAGSAAPRQAMDRLRKRIRPWMLRRLKADVAKDLPPRIEQVRYCELSAGQQALYEAVLRESRKKIDDALSAKSEGQARMTMLTALLRLRQICCDPRLLNLDEPPEGSGKLDALGELLDEALDGGHKILIFSQFVSMLHLLRDELDQREIPFCYLDGSSRDRAEQVALFQKDPAQRVFLISLKAGGYGLNLTAADTVVHFDPWWNPAVEAQATDRAHRIGQSRTVTSYKLITTGTVEERILALQRKKRAVIEAALDDGQPLMQGLSTDEIRDVIG